MMLSELNLYINNSALCVVLYIEMSIFLPGVIAGLQFTVDGGEESRTNISKVNLIKKGLL